LQADSAVLWNIKNFLARCFQEYFKKKLEALADKRGINLPGREL